MVSQSTTISLAIATPFTVLCIGGIILALYRHHRYQQAQRKQSHDLSLADSFPPSPGSDDRDWSRVSLQQMPSSNIASQSHMQGVPHSGFHSPRNTTQTVSFLRIGRPGHNDSRERLQSVSSTLSHHAGQTPPTNALGQVRADRIGSGADLEKFSQKRRNTSLTYLDEAVRKKSSSTMASSRSTGMGSFSIGRARRASIPVRKVSAGGAEELMPITLASSERDVPQPTSPPDLDGRFAESLSVGNLPPSKIDFTQPFDTTQHPSPAIAKDTLQSSYDVRQRHSLMPTAVAEKRLSIEPALPSSKICSPAQPPPDRSSVQLLSKQSPGHMDAIPQSPLDSGQVVPPRAQETGAANEDSNKRHTVCSSTSKTSKRSSTSRKKRRPDSIDLAMVRSPKLAVHHVDHLVVPSPSPPPLTAALADLKHGIASSVMALKSATTSAHFPYSVPSAPSPKTVVPRTPRTPLTATSEGGHSIMSDLESAQLFQAWKGFRAPPTPDPQPPSVRRAISAPNGGVRPKITNRPDTDTGELAVEVVNSRTVTPVQSRPTANIDFSRMPSDEKLPVNAVRNSLTPSPGNSRASSPQPKITYLSEVVKENEKRSSGMS